MHEDDLKLRIGIHQGEVVFEGEDVFGDGVNIASRLEPLAPIGGILVSESVYWNIENKKGIKTKFLREETLKNVKHPIKIYQVKVEGVVAPAKAPEPATRKFFSQMKTGLTAMGGLVILGLAYLLYDNSSNTGEVAGTKLEVLDKSIAVIPFNNMSNDPEQQYFSDGVMEAILNHLTKIEDLKVISRTSVMQYRNTEKTSPQIAEELGVSYLLEGAVQTSGGKVRINAQLIDAIHDTHVWSENYDRELTDIFAIQSDVANLIAEAMQIELTVQSKKEINKKPTDNTEAYDYYLKGNEYYYSSYAVKDLEIALKMFERAVELDPNFALALVKLASTHRLIYWIHLIDRDGSAQRAKEKIDQALEVDPELVEAKIELGWYYYHFHRDYETALEILFQAKSRVPDNSDLLYALCTIYRRKGDLAKSLEYNLRAIEVDPGASAHWVQAAWTYMMLRDYSKAEGYYGQCLVLSPGFNIAIYGLTQTYLMQENKVSLATKLLQNYQGNAVLLEDPYFVYIQFLTHLFNRNMDSAIRDLSYLQSEIISDQFHFLPVTLLKSLAYHLKGDNELALSSVKEAADILTGEIQKDP